MRDFRKNQDTRRVSDEALLRSLQAASARGPAPAASNIVYVNKGGSDVTGNGSFGLPFLTIGAALSRITDASVNKSYLVLVGPGNYTEDVALIPFAYVQGQELYGQIIGVQSMSLSAAWASVVGLSFAGANSLVVENDMILNFSGVQDGNLTFDTVYVDGNFSLTGDPVNGGFVNLRACEIVGTMNVTGASVEPHELTFDSNVSLFSTASQPVVWNSVGGGSFYDVTLTVDSTAGKPAEVMMGGTAWANTLALAGAATSFVGSTSSIPSLVTLSAGAPPPVPINYANGLGYTPGTPANWAGPAPTLTQQALDRMATLLVSLHGGPIP